MGDGAPLSPPLPPPLPPGPPPPLAPDDAPPPSQLTQLFRDHKATLACQLLQQLSAPEAVCELQAAFNAVEWAPSAFLLALSQWPASAPRNVFFTLVATGNDCMNAHYQQFAIPPSPMISDLAGTLLLEAFGDCRAHTCAAFVAAFNVGIRHLHTHCMRMIHTHVKLVVTVLDVLNQRQLLPLDVVVMAAIQQNEFEAADTFVRDDAAQQRIYLQMLMDHRVPDKIIKKRMIKFKVDDEEFPEYHARRVRASIRFLVYNQQFEDVLSLVQRNGELAVYASHFVVNHRGSQDPVARLFIYRAGHADRDEFAYIDTTGMETAVFPNKDELEPLANCLSLVDLVGADACVFVDTPEALATCVAHLRAAPVVGFDCEWKTATTRGQPSEVCAVLQVASATRAFVVDTIALKGQCAPLSEIFLSESIVKLGFDTKGDVSVLAKVLPNGTAVASGGGGAVVRNLVDVQALAKRLRSVKRPRLKSDLAPAASLDGELEDGEVVEEDQSRSAISPHDPVDEPAGGDTRAADSDAVGNTTALTGLTQPVTVDEVSSTTKKHRKKKQKRRNGRGGDAVAGDGDGQDEGDSSSLSLASVAENYLGKPLDKRSRMSDWERRPLTKAQLYYAAMDALVLVVIFDVMRQRFSEEEFGKALAELSRPRSAAGATTDPASRSVGVSTPVAPEPTES